MQEDLDYCDDPYCPVDVCDYCAEFSVATVVPKQEWNTDPEWQEYTTGFEKVIAQISNKYCSDVDLRQDCAQEARIALLHVFPEKVDHYEQWREGRITEEQWRKRLSTYCRQVVKYSILSFLDSPKKGNWYVGRTRRAKDNVTGERRKVYQPARYSSLDQLVDDFGMQVSDTGEISWDKASTDGLDMSSGREN